MNSIPLPLRAYQMASHLMPYVAKRHITKRIAKNKEHPTRWVERFAQPSHDRPAGKLIWFHAVGLGEVMSLRGLIHVMADQSDAHFLVTSGTLSAAVALAKSPPPRTVHQFLPLDAPRYRKAFLNHWKPDICIWAEQDLWPGFVMDLAARGIPQALIAARMNDQSARKKIRFSKTFLHLYNQMAYMTALNPETQASLAIIGVKNVPILGSLKQTSPPLSYSADELARLKGALKGRFVWITAPSHPNDEALALAAHNQILAQRPDALLIIAPRYTDRTLTLDLPTAVRSKGDIPTADHAIYLADTFGDLGLLYRLTTAALIGGTNDDNDGHSPWEAANLQTAIFHGPRTKNFKTDYATLDAAHAAVKVTDPTHLATLLMQDLTSQIANASDVIEQQRATTDKLAHDLLALI